MRFEYFLTLLKNADCMIGNSSSGIREACIYGIPAIDIGIRQKGRYKLSDCPNIIHIDEPDMLLSAMEQTHNLQLTPVSYFGSGNSNLQFRDILLKEKIWTSNIQKQFMDLDF